MMRFLDQDLLIGAAVLSALPAPNSDNDRDEDEEYDEVEGGA